MFLNTSRPTRWVEKVGSKLSTSQGTPKVIDAPSWFPGASVIVRTGETGSPISSPTR